MHIVLYLLGAILAIAGVIAWASSSGPTPLGESQAIRSLVAQSYLFSGLIAGAFFAGLGKIIELLMEIRDAASSPRDQATSSAPAPAAAQAQPQAVAPTPRTPEQKAQAEKEHKAETRKMFIIMAIVFGSLIIAIMISNSINGIR